MNYKNIFEMERFPWKREVHMEYGCFFENYKKDFRRESCLETTSSFKFAVLIVLFITMGVVLKLLDKPAFEIYLVKPYGEAKANAYLSGIEKPNEKQYQTYLNLVALEAYPIVTDKDIEYYDWKNHKIIFTDKFIQKDKDSYKSYGERALYGFYDCTFMVVSKGKRMYIGDFRQVYIRTSFVKRDHGTVITSNSANSIDISKNDSINDTRIYKALNAKGKIIE